MPTDKMASDNEACVTDPNFAIICSFFDKFGKICGVPYPNIQELQTMLDNSQEVHPALIDLHVKLLRKAKKNVQADKWERALVKFMHSYSSHDAWNLERFGYKKIKPTERLIILKNLLEMQFDTNTKFKAIVTQSTAADLRLEPIGRDRRGNAYWYQVDDDCNMRVYKEDLDEELWTLVAQNREQLSELITKLDGNNDSSNNTISNEDSNSVATISSLLTAKANEDSISAENKNSNIDSKNFQVDPDKPAKEKIEMNEDSDEFLSPDEDDENYFNSEIVNDNAQDGIKKVIKSDVNLVTQIKCDDNKKPVIEELDTKPTLCAELAISENNKRKRSDSGEEKTDDIASDIKKSKITIEGESDLSKQDDLEVGEAIEDPVFYVSGQGAGADCDTGNPGETENTNKNQDEALDVSLKQDIKKDIESTSEIKSEKAEASKCSSSTKIDLVNPEQESSKDETLCIKSVEKKPLMFFGQPGCLKLNPVMVKTPTQTALFGFSTVTCTKTLGRTMELNLEKKDSDSDVKKSEEVFTNSQVKSESVDMFSEVEEKCSEVAEKCDGGVEECSESSQESRTVLIDSVCENVADAEISSSADSVMDEKNSSDISASASALLENSDKIEYDLEDPDLVMNTSSSEEKSQNHSASSTVLYEVTSLNIGASDKSNSSFIDNSSNLLSDMSITFDDGNVSNKNLDTEMSDDVEKIDAVCSNAQSLVGASENILKTDTKLEESMKKSENISKVDNEPVCIASTSKAGVVDIRSEIKLKGNVGSSEINVTQDLESDLRLGRKDDTDTALEQIKSKTETDRGIKVFSQNEADGAFSKESSPKISAIQNKNKKQIYDEQYDPYFMFVVPLASKSMRCGPVYNRPDVIPKKIEAKNNSEGDETKVTEKDSTMRDSNEVKKEINKNKFSEDEAILKTKLVEERTDKESLRHEEINLPKGDVIRKEINTKNIKDDEIEAVKKDPTDEVICDDVKGDIGEKQISENEDLRKTEESKIDPDDETVRDRETIPKEETILKAEIDDKVMKEVDEYRISEDIGNLERSNLVDEEFHDREAIPKEECILKAEIDEINIEKKDSAITSDEAICDYVKKELDNPISEVIRNSEEAKNEKLDDCETIPKGGTILNDEKDNAGKECSRCEEIDADVISISEATGVLEKSDSLQIPKMTQSNSDMNVAQISVDESLKSSKDSLLDSKNIPKILNESEDILKNAFEKSDENTQSNVSLEVLDVTETDTKISATDIAKSAIEDDTKSLENATKREISRDTDPKIMDELKSIKDESNIIEKIEDVHESSKIPKEIIEKNMNTSEENTFEKGDEDTVKISEEIMLIEDPKVLDITEDLVKEKAKEIDIKTNVKNKIDAFDELSEASDDEICTDDIEETTNQVINNPSDNLERLEDDQITEVSLENVPKPTSTKRIEKIEECADKDENSVEDTIDDLEKESSSEIKTAFDLDSDEKSSEILMEKDLSSIISPKIISEVELDLGTKTVTLEDNTIYDVPCRQEPAKETIEDLSKKIISERNLIASDDLKTSIDFEKKIDAFDESTEKILDDISMHKNLPIEIEDKIDISANIAQVETKIEKPINVCAKISVDKLCKENEKTSDNVLSTTLMNGLEEDFDIGDSNETENLQKSSTSSGNFSSHRGTSYEQSSKRHRKSETEEIEKSPIEIAENIPETKDVKAIETDSQIDEIDKQSQITLGEPSESVPEIKISEMGLKDLRSIELPETNVQVLDLTTIEDFSKAKPVVDLDNSSKVVEDVVENIFQQVSKEVLEASVNSEMGKDVTVGLLVDSDRNVSENASKVIVESLSEGVPIIPMNLETGKGVFSDLLKGSNSKISESISKTTVESRDVLTDSDASSQKIENSDLAQSEESVKQKELSEHSEDTSETIVGEKIPSLQDETRTESSPDLLESEKLKEFEEKQENILEAASDSVVNEKDAIKLDIKRTETANQDLIPKSTQSISSDKGNEESKMSDWKDTLQSRIKIDDKSLETQLITSPNEDLSTKVETPKIITNIEQEADTIMEGEKSDDSSELKDLRKAALESMKISDNLPKSSVEDSNKTDIDESNEMNTVTKQKEEEEEHAQKTTLPIASGNTKTTIDESVKKTENLEEISDAKDTKQDDSSKSTDNSKRQQSVELIENSRKIHENFDATKMSVSSSDSEVTDPLKDRTEEEIANSVLRNTIVENVIQEVIDYSKNSSPGSSVVEGAGMIHLDSDDDGISDREDMGSCAIDPLGGTLDYTIETPVDMNKKTDSDTSEHGQQSNKSKTRKKKTADTIRVVNKISELKIFRADKPTRSAAKNTATAIGNKAPTTNTSGSGNRKRRISEDAAMESDPLSGAGPPGGGGSEDDEDEPPQPGGKRIKMRGRKTLDSTTRQNAELKKRNKRVSSSEEETKIKEKAKSDDKAEKSARKPRKRTRRIMGLVVDEDAIISKNDESNVRQSRRIAQLKIREEAERRKVEEITLLQLKEQSQKKRRSKNDDKEYRMEKRKRKQRSDESSDDSDSDVESENRGGREEDADLKGKKKGKRGRKKKEAAPPSFDESRPWRSSSESSSDKDLAEDEDLYEHEHTDDEHIMLKSDHEFSPESDLEGGEAQPTRRARTVKKDAGDAEASGDHDEHRCQHCGKSDQPEWILLCDACDCGYHCSCLKPVLLVIPEGDWYCPPCQQKRLITNLGVHLVEFDKLMKKKEIEDLRKQRLAYVGISAANVLPDDDTKKIKTAKAEHEKSGESSGSGSSSESDSESEEEDETGYKLRERRSANMCYRFNDYDDLINSAIKDEMDVVKGAGNMGRGKDISTIIDAEKEERKDAERKAKEEAKLLAAAAAGDSAVDQSGKSDDEKTKNEEGKKKSDSEDDSDSDRPINPILLVQKKKQRKLNNLDETSEEDHVSDEDFKESTPESDDEELDSDATDDSELDMRTRKGGGTRRSTRARTTRYDKAFINDSDESSSQARRAAKTKKRSRGGRIFSDEETSEDEQSMTSTSSEDSDAAGWKRRSRKKTKQNNNRSRNRSTSAANKKKRPAMPKKTETEGIGDSPKKPKKKKRTSELPDLLYRSGGLSKILDHNESGDAGGARRTRGRKINYVEALVSDEEEDKRKKKRAQAKRIISEDEYNPPEDEPKVETPEEEIKQGQQLQQAFENKTDPTTANKRPKTEENVPAIGIPGQMTLTPIKSDNETTTGTTPMVTPVKPGRKPIKKSVTPMAIPDVDGAQPIVPKEFSVESSPLVVGTTTIMNSSGKPSQITLSRLQNKVAGRCGGGAPMTPHRRPMPTIRKPGAMGRIPVPKMAKIDSSLELDEDELEDEEEEDLDDELDEEEDDLEEEDFDEDLIAGGPLGDGGGPGEPEGPEAEERMARLMMEDQNFATAQLQQVAVQIAREKRRKAAEEKRAEKERRKQERIQKRDDKIRMKEERAREREEKRLAKQAAMAAAVATPVERKKPGRKPKSLLQQQQQQQSMMMGGVQVPPNQIGSGPGGPIRMPMGQQQTYQQLMPVAGQPPNLPSSNITMNLLTSGKPRGMVAAMASMNNAKTVAATTISVPHKSPLPSGQHEAPGQNSRVMSPPMSPSTNSSSMSSTSASGGVSGMSPVPQNFGMSPGRHPMQHPMMNQLGGLPRPPLNQEMPQFQPGASYGVGDFGRSVAKRRGRGRGKKTLAAEAAAIAANPPIPTGPGGMNSIRNEQQDDNKQSTGASNLSVAAPPQPFSASQPAPSVITRMLHNPNAPPGVGGPPPQQTSQQQRASPGVTQAGGYLGPSGGGGGGKYYTGLPPMGHHLDPHHAQYMQRPPRPQGPPGLGMYRPPGPMGGYHHPGGPPPGARGAPGPPPGMYLHSAHHPHDPSPSGGGPINIAGPAAPPSQSGAPLAVQQPPQQSPSPSMIRPGTPPSKPMPPGGGPRGGYEYPGGGRHPSPYHQQPPYGYNTPQGFVQQPSPYHQYEHGHPPTTVGLNAPSTGPPTMNQGPVLNPQMIPTSQPVVPSQLPGAAQATSGPGGPPNLPPPPQSISINPIIPISQQHQVMNLVSSQSSHMIPVTDGGGYVSVTDSNTGAGHRYPEQDQQGPVDQDHEDDGESGEFGGLVSYFSSQREDDLDT